MKLLLYCVKAKPYLYHDYDYCFDTMNTIDLGYKTFEYTNQRVYDDETGKFLGWETYGNMFKNDSLNGKIVAECDFEVEKIENNVCGFGDYKLPYFETETLTGKEIEDKSCLSYEQLKGYLQNNGNGFYGYSGYAIHIKNLKIFDKPKELSEYHISYFNKEFNMMREKHIEKAPQNMCRAFDIKDTYILISIRPEWLCKILNGEKTIECRKRILKEMMPK